MISEKVEGVTASPQVVVTTDLALAAYYSVKGLRLIRLKKVGRNGRNNFNFMFADPEDRSSELGIDYVNSESRRFDESMRAIKKAVSQERDKERPRKRR